MPDLSDLSDDELKALYAKSAAPKPLSDMSDDELRAAYGGSSQHIDTTSAYVRGIPDIPVVGPWVKGGLQRAAAASQAIPQLPWEKENKFSSKPSFGERYQENLDKEQQQDTQAQHEHPFAYGAGQFTGSLLPVSKALSLADKGVKGGLALSGLGTTASGAARSFPALTAMGTSGALGAADTGARGGSSSDMWRDAIFNALGSGVLSSAGKALGFTSKQFIPKWTTKQEYYVDQPDAWFTRSLKGMSQSELKDMFDKKTGSLHHYIRVKDTPVQEEPSHGTMQAIGTLLGGVAGHAFGGTPEGAFVGYGLAPGLAPLVQRYAPKLAEKAGPAATNPFAQAIMYGLGRRGEDLIK